MLPSRWLLLKNCLRRCKSTATHTGPEKKKICPTAKKSHAQKLAQFFKTHRHLTLIKPYIPSKYLALKRLTPPENLYLIDEEIGKKAAAYVLPYAQKNPNQIVCETNAGLGFVTHELLEKGLELVRLYENCPEFKLQLKTKFEKYLGRVELCTKDIFLLQRYDYMDKQDHGNRVEQLLQGVPRKSWSDEPAMTVIGPMPNMNFIRFLFKALVLQSFVILFGRIELFVFMRPRDYIILTAGPHLNLHTYQRWSVLFNLLFDFELLDKYPRDMFLPWQSPKSAQRGRYPGQVDPDLMYFVRICFKKDLPVSTENLLPLYAFVVQFFGRGTKKVIPTLEKWVPGCGIDILVPKLKHPDYFPDMNIFTQFGELNPTQILAVFEEMTTHPEYTKSHFVSLIESQLIKTETIESSLDEHFEKHVMERIESKLE